MRHVFRATKLGWDEEREGIWFDSDEFTEEEARAQFEEYEGVTMKGFPYTGYEFDGQKYHDVEYLGEFDDDDMPTDDSDLWRKRHGL